VLYYIECWFGSNDGLGLVLDGIDCWARFGTELGARLGRVLDWSQ